VGLLTRIFGNREDRATASAPILRMPVEASVGEGGHLTSTPAPAMAEDPDEIDVSDQLEELDDADATGDLDASEYLIIEDEDHGEEGETSTGVALPGAAGAAATPIRLAPLEGVSGPSNAALPEERGAVLPIPGEDALRAWLGPASSAWAVEMQRAAALLQGAATGQRNPGSAALLSRLSRLVQDGSREELLRVISEQPLSSLGQLFASLDGLKSLQRPRLERERALEQPGLASAETMAESFETPISRARELVAVAAANAAERQTWLPELGQGTALRRALSDLEHIDREFEACDPEQPRELHAARERWRDAVMRVSLLLSETGERGLPEELARGPSGSAGGRLGAAPRDSSNPDPQRTTMLSETKIVKQTLLEAGTEFKGSLESSCPVIVNGTIDGKVDAPLVSIARTGAVFGVIKAKTLRSAGTLSGNVDAGDVFVSGAVRSHTVIKARRLEVNLGSSDRGQLEVTFGRCDIAESDIGESDTQFAPMSSTESASESLVHDGWESPEVADGTPSL
jgi:cytoskeletal protein CcmA (bactofilin family)